MRAKTSCASARSHEPTKKARRTGGEAGTYALGDTGAKLVAPFRARGATLGKGLTQKALLRKESPTPSVESGSLRVYTWLPGGCI